jgi:beta-lactamase class C
MTSSISRRQALAGCLMALPALPPLARSAWAQADRPAIDRVIDGAIKPVMERNEVPGMAVAVTVRGRRSLFYYGVATKESGQKVGEHTLFEIGSLSKTFTATLACLAQMRGALALADPASKYLPALAGSSFDRISLLDLATYTAGGLPLQFPDDVTDRAKMIAYFKRWQPSYAPGTRRLYSNPSIGLFGYLAARSLGRLFDDLMQGELFPALGLERTYITVPRDQMDHYAYGYAKDDKPTRVNPGMFDSEAYGVKTTAADMIRFVEANIDSAGLDDMLRRAIAATHTGYYKVGDMMQAIGWEMYVYPVALDRLLAGNSSDMALNSHAVTRLAPPASPRPDVLINKTGSTNGFGAYAAFVPATRLGVVILANRNFPIADRVRAAYAVLAALADGKR